ncbi:MAG: hypothetical protein HC880_09935 [Bacteroidia bacterium]|nr:hypothetical protein [Bacteroidia bacterium]
MLILCGWALYDLNAFPPVAITHEDVIPMDEERILKKQNGYGREEKFK